ncbi:hypothetical protein QQ045_007759 [Rhodiola kirilowii]
MGIYLHCIISNAKQILKLQSLVSSRNQLEVPKGHIAVYVGEIQIKRYCLLQTLHAFKIQPKSNNVSCSKDSTRYKDELPDC